MRILASIFSLILILTISTNCLCQQQNNQWRFGNGGGINFNTTPPNFTGGSAITTSEGSASVADKTSGSLLFYTNGVTVWDAQNQVMPNGNGLLGGSTALSSTTAAVIIPKPGSNNLYYIVTIDEQFSPNGVQYSIVDMNRNGGLGDIVNNQKNIFLFQTSSEKLEVVPAANGQDVWLITHDNPGNTFYSFLLTSAGFQTTPVVSTIGGTHGNGSGHLKINRQFNKLAMGNFFDSSVELFDFNNANGVVSNPVIWNFISTSPTIYGVEFSPNGKFLYVSNLNTVTQYNISSSSPVSIENSRFVLSSFGFNQPASLQLGPDNKIYITAGSIDVINCPNNPGIDCGFQSNAIPNQTGGGGYGFPKWVYHSNINLPIIPNIIIYSDSCFGNATQFTIKDTTGITSVNWTFGDPNSGANNTAAGFSVSHTFSQTGSYSVTAILTNACGNDTLILDPLEIVDCNVPCNSSIAVITDSCLQNQIGFAITTNNVVLGIDWNFGDPTSGVNNTSNSTAPRHGFTSTGTYLIEAIVNLDCGIDTLQKRVTIIDCDTIVEECKLFIPTAFTPDGNGLNENFKPFSRCTLEKFELQIFNRWGETIYKSSNPNASWNGKYKEGICPVGVYIYQLKYKFPSKPINQTKGTIMLLK
jgi:gliding motility-associated-like protein